MTSAKIIRRGMLATGLVTLAGAIAGRGMAGQRTAADAAGHHAFAKTDEAGLRTSDAALSPRARALIRIGDVGIVREDPQALSDFFHPDFRFHGPAGAELTREQLWAYFAACRAAFDDFTIIRQTLVSDGRDHIAARTRFAGRFVRTFTGIPDDPIEPNGRPFAYTLLNLFRYGPNGQLTEEWAQYDTSALFDQLRR
jgi:predicted ester cyclase